MKTCYYVKTRIDNCGHASVIETGAVDVKELPEGRCSSTDYEDIYTDWFETVKRRTTSSVRYGAHTTQRAG